MKKRICILDEVRGAAVVLMIIYHGLFNLYYSFGMDLYIFRTEANIYFALFIGSSFMIISGISSYFSSNIRKRAGICFIAAMTVTAVTAIFMPEMTIYFGILHFMSVAMLLSPYIKKMLDGIQPMAFILICALGFILTFNVQFGYFGVKPDLFLRIPSILRDIKILFPIGICSYSFTSGDYYPILPWIFVYSIGIVLGEYFISGNLPDFYYREHSKVLGFIGRHSLIIYLIHQPIIYGIMYLIFNFSA